MGGVGKSSVGQGWPRDSLADEVAAPARADGWASVLALPQVVSTRSCLRASVGAHAPIIVWAVLVVATVSLSLSHFGAYQLGTAGDDSKYVVLAESLLHSDRYGLINIPGEPVPEHFPFGYPLVLSAVVAVFPGDHNALIIPSLVATVLNTSILIRAWRWLSPGRSLWWGLGVAALYSVAPLTIDHTRQVMSEPVFTTFCLLALVLTERGARGKTGLLWTTSMAIVLTFAMYTRTIGIVLVVVCLAYLLAWKRKSIAPQIGLVLVQMALVLGVITAATSVTVADLLPTRYLEDPNAALLVAPLRAIGALPDRSSARGSDASATGSPGDSTGPIVGASPVTPPVSILDALVSSARRHLSRDVKGVVLPIGGGSREDALAASLGQPDLPVYLGFIVSGLVLLGLLRMTVGRRVTVFGVFALAYLVSVLFWNWDGPRLLYPIQPQIQLGFLLGLEASILFAASLLARLRKAPALTTIAMAMLVLTLVLGSIYKSASIDDTRLHVGDLAQRTAWLRANAAPTDVLMSEAPETDYLYGGTKTVPYPAQPVSSEELEAYLSRYGVRYILVAPAVVWQSSYSPQYSPSTRALLDDLDGLTREGKVTLAHQEDNLIQVFRVGA